MDRMAESGRARAFVRRHPLVFDGGLTLVLWLLVVLLQAGARDDTIWGLPAWLVIAGVGTAQVAPLVWRRRQPEAVFAVVACATLVSGLANRQLAASDLAFLFALYALAAFGARSGVRLAGLVVGLVGAAAASVLWQQPSTPAPTWAPVVTGLVSISLTVTVVWLWGTNTRQRRERLDSLQARNEALVRERDQLTQLAAQEERARIARDLHDIVAHSLSVIVVQADGAAYAARHNPRWGPDESVAALTTIAMTAREALGDTRSLVGVLRTGDEEQYRPQPTLSDVPALVERVRKSGHEVTLDFTPSDGELRTNAGLTAFRVVQEGLTNTLKHAGPGAHSTVVVTHMGDTVTVSITDDGRGAAATSDGAGHGLLGLQERIGAAGGTLRHGPRPGGGYALVAHLPAAPGAIHK